VRGALCIVTKKKKYPGHAKEAVGFKTYFMSFCRILSTLCCQVVFHIVPHFGKRAGQKIQRKIAAAVQKVKPLYFLSRSFEISETNCQQSFFLF
jgi:hypothetical protein